MKNGHHIFISLLLLTAVLQLPATARAQYQKVSVGFYNTENLFDTVSSPFHDDHEFIPQSRRHWNSERYRRKLDNMARVIDDAGFDVLALAEVENEGVVRDLVMTLSDDYNYIHRTSSDSRGIDLAMLYKGDKFFPEHVELIDSDTPREFLFVEGSLAGDNVAFLVCHLPSKLNSEKFRKSAFTRLATVADSLVTTAGYEKLVILGDFNGELDEPPLRTIFPTRPQTGIFIDTLYRCRTHGFGSYCWGNHWLLYDNIVVSKALTQPKGLHVETAGIFIRDYMLTGTNSPVQAGRVPRGYPKRTFYGYRYTGGYSDHLPVFVIFTK